MGERFKGWQPLGEPVISDAMSTPRRSVFLETLSRPLETRPPLMRPRFTFDCGGVEAESATSQLTRSARPDVPSGSSANGRFFLKLPVCHCPSFVEQNQRTDCATKDVPIKQGVGQGVLFSGLPVVTSTRLRIRVRGAICPRRETRVRVFIQSLPHKSFGQLYLKTHSGNV